MIETILLDIYDLRLIRFTIFKNNLLIIKALILKIVNRKSNQS